VLLDEIALGSFSPPSQSSPSYSFFTREAARRFRRRRYRPAGAATATARQIALAFDAALSDEGRERSAPVAASSTGLGVRTTMSGCG